jgi:hypothetical protein
MKTKTYNKMLFKQQLTNAFALSIIALCLCTQASSINKIDAHSAIVADDQVEQNNQIQQMPDMIDSNQSVETENIIQSIDSNESTNSIDSEATETSYESFDNISSANLIAAEDDIVPLLPIKPNSGITSSTYLQIQSPQTSIPESATKITIGRLHIHASKADAPRAHVASINLVDVTDANRPVLVARASKTIPGITGTNEHVHIESTAYDVKYALSSTHQYKYVAQIVDDVTGATIVNMAGPQVTVTQSQTQSPLLPIPPKPQPIVATPQQPIAVTPVATTPVIQQPISTPVAVTTPTQQQQQPIQSASPAATPSQSQTVSTNPTTHTTSTQYSMKGRVISAAHQTATSQALALLFTASAMSAILVAFF